MANMMQWRISRQIRLRVKKHELTDGLQETDGVLSAAYTQAGHARLIAATALHSAHHTHVFVAFRSEVMEHTASLAESRPAVKCVSTRSTT